MEMSFVSLNKILILQEIEKGGKKAKIIEKLYNNPNETVSSILLCNNLVNIAASILAGMIAINFFGDIGIGIATAMMTFFVVVFGEAIPKSYGINNQKFFIFSSKYLLILSKIFSPISHSLSFISNPIIRMLGKNVSDKSVFTEDEIKVMLKVGVKNGSIKKDEKRMVEDVFDFDETKAIEVYTPKNRILGINENNTLMSLKKLVVDTGHSRFPVFDDKKDIIGVVHLKDALLKDKNLLVSSIMKSVLKISPNMKVDTVLRKMQKKKTHMAILESNENKILGLVTMEDLIEEIFGDIKDEHD
jgi:CBS domain containing-hemolysin-like protein